MNKKPCNTPPIDLNDLEFDDAIINQLNYNYKLVNSFLKECYNVEAFEYKFNQIEPLVINNIDLSQYITADQACKLLQLKESSFYNISKKFNRVKLSRIMLYKFDDVKDHIYRSLEVFK